jgi:glycolate oxidase iron-sulfur subunit
MSAMARPEGGPQQGRLALGKAARRAIDTCVHCGLCLPACPTYRELGQEADSPRGRIHLVAAAAEGRLTLDAEALTHLDLCLGCLACESACPSGVGYGHILEAARGETEERRPRPGYLRLLRRLLLRGVLPRPGLLRALARLAGWGAALRLPALAARLRLLPPHLAELAAVTPRAAGRPGRQRVPASLSQSGEPRVSLFLGCVQDVLFPQTNAATGRVLAAHGCRVECPVGQLCCGALHAHAGDLETARSLARRNLDAFASAEGALVAVNAAGCGAHLKRYGELLADDPEAAPRAAELAARVRDLTELVAELREQGRRPPLAWPGGRGPVAYQDPCHLAHGQGVRRQPRTLLEEMEGAEVREIADDACCGSAGFYNLVQPEMAAAVLARKLDALRRSGAAVVATANPGCLIQLRAGLKRAGLPLRVVHLADLLDQALAAGAEGATPTERPTADRRAAPAAARHLETSDG